MAQGQEGKVGKREKIPEVPAPAPCCFYPKPRLHLLGGMPSQNWVVRYVQPNRGPVGEAVVMGPSEEYCEQSRYHDVPPLLGTPSFYHYLPMACKPTGCHSC